MTTIQPIPSDNGPEDPSAYQLPGESSSDLGYPTTSVVNIGNGSGRRARRRSVYQFPSYDFETAFNIAKEVEESGAGTLTEETLAVNLGLSKSSSGFRLKCLAARHFGLLTKQGASVSTTAIAKAILKPTSEEDALRGYQQSFLSIPLFGAVAERYMGQRLPDSQTLRNVLEREFQVEPKRVQQAERMLLDSARTTQLLKHDNDGTYLAISQRLVGPDEFSEPDAESKPAIGAASGPRPNAAGGPAHDGAPQASVNVLSFSLDEIGQLSEEDFEPVWRAVGILVKARGARKRSETEENGHLSLE